MTAAVDIAPLLDRGRWTGYQKFLTALTAITVIFDGFDIQILGFAIPSLMKEWGVARTVFGPVLALGLAGMAAGSPLAGYFGDRYGRRPALIGCMLLFGGATVATSLVNSVFALAALRFVTGVGAGGALPNATALVAEFSPLRRRPLAVKLTIVCVPLGGMMGGLIAARILPAMGWRALYQVGATLPLVFAAVIYALLPESPRFLVQSARSWPLLEGLLGRMGRPVPAGSNFADSGERRVQLRAPLRVLLVSLGRDTAGLWVAFLFCVGGIYLVFGCLPVMLTMQGFDVASASRALAVYNFGGVLGVLVWAALMTSLGSRGPLLSGALAAAGSAIAILLVPVQSEGSRELILAGLACNGLLTNAVQTSMYALAAHVYPAAVRASGVAYAGERWLSRWCLRLPDWHECAVTSRRSVRKTAARCSFLRKRMMMMMERRLWIAVVISAAAALGQDRAGGRGGLPGTPTANAGRGAAPAQPPLSTTPKPAIPNAKPVRSCESLAAIALPNTTIESAAVDPASPGICRVTAFTTHPPAGDKVRIWTAIPTSNWNGRFLGTGGGGFSGGSPGGVNQPATLGYASGATDTGHQGGSGSFALDANGRLNWQLIRDNAHVGIHEMTVTGRALTEAMYGVAPRYSYFNGCSTGGRQGLMEAQRYPQDYDGIVSGSPAINWNRLHPQQLWGAMLMNATDNPIPACKLEAATAAAAAACDAIDGVRDGVIEDPNRCNYDPKPLIGTSAGDCGSFTEADVDLIRKFWQGPRREDGSFLWYGLARGADLRALWGSRGTPLRPQAFGITLDWFRYFLAQNPQLDWTTITPAAYERFWDQSVEEFGIVIGTDNPDLTGFRDRGGKAIIWHGWADPLITAEGTIDYYRRVQQQTGGAEKTSQFARLFMAPGVGHCGGGAGPGPYGQLDALLSWVEDGKPPATLTAARRDQSGTVTRSRPLCQYPLVARYKGTGSTDDAANFVCSTGF